MKPTQPKSKKRFPKKESVSFTLGNRSMREFDKDSIDEKVLIPSSNTDKANPALLKELQSVLPSQEAPNLLSGWRGTMMHVPDDLNEALESSEDESRPKNNYNKKNKNATPTTSNANKEKTKFEELDDDFVKQAQSDVRVPSFSDSDTEDSDLEFSDDSGFPDEDLEGYTNDLNDIDDAPAFFNQRGKAVGNPQEQNKLSLQGYISRLQENQQLTSEAKEYRVFLEEKFNLVMQKQQANDEDSDREGVVLPEGGGVDISEFSSVLDEFLNDERQHFNPDRWEELGIQPAEDDDQSYVSKFRVKKKSLKEDPFFSKPDYHSKTEIRDIVKRDLVHQMEPEHLEDLSDSDSSEGWDVETILSTYTNTENHPALIVEAVSQDKKIQLSKKTGIPLGVLPERTQLRPSKPTQNTGQSRPKDETADEKKLRKKQLKEEKKKIREEKKLLKTAFTVESRIQKKQQIANPAVSKIRIH